MLTSKIMWHLPEGNLTAIDPAKGNLTAIDPAIVMFYAFQNHTFSHYYISQGPMSLAINMPNDILNKNLMNTEFWDISPSISCTFPMPELLSSPGYVTISQ